MQGLRTNASLETYYALFIHYLIAAYLPNVDSVIQDHVIICKLLELRVTIPNEVQLAFNGLSQQ